MTSIYLFQL